MRWRYRTNWRGKLILQVWEASSDSNLTCSGGWWRDATVEDLTEHSKEAP